MPLFREYQPGIAPPWLQGEYGAAWLRALGDGKDALVEREKAAVKARMPTLAPYDALPALGSERQIDRLASDTNATYANRIQGAWRVWPWAGTAQGLLNAINDAGFGGGFLEIVNGLQYSLNDNREAVVTKLQPGSWSIDATPAFWSKFQIFYPANPFKDVSPTSPEIATMRALIARWKPAFATCAGIVIWVDGELWGYPQGPWSDPGVWGGHSIFIKVD